MATAKAISMRLGVAVEIDRRLIEISLGAWEGRLRSDLIREAPARLDDREWLFSAPGGESFDDVSERVADWLAEHGPDAERRFIVVSHGVSGRVLRGLYGGLSRAETIAQAVPQDAIFRLADGRIDRLECEPVGDR